MRYRLELRVTNPALEWALEAQQRIEGHLQQLGDRPVQQLRPGADATDAAFDYSVVLFDVENAQNVPNLLGQPWTFSATRRDGDWSVTRNFGARGPGVNDTPDLAGVLEELTEFRGGCIDHALAAAVTAEEQRQLEVIVRAVRATLDELDRPGDPVVAQTYIAIDTVAIQIRAPEPSRRIIRDALSQIPQQFLVGVLSGAAATYLSQWLPHLAH